MIKLIRTLIILLCTPALDVCSGASSECINDETCQTCIRPEGDGGWSTNKDDIIVAEGPCNIERVYTKTLTQKEFELKFVNGGPVVLKTCGNNQDFRDLCTKENILLSHGHKSIRLSSANTHSYERSDVTLNHYINKVMKPQKRDSLGNETFYWFGDNNYTEWENFFQAYIPPNYRVPNHSPAYSFGIAGAGTGVPFHFHGPGFGEVIYGRKRWFLYPPNKRPSFNPDKTTLTWYLNEYRNLSVQNMPYECTLEPGDVLYFPDRWWHATLNIDTSVFISTFLSPA